MVCGAIGEILGDYNKSCDMVEKIVYIKNVARFRNCPYIRKARLICFLSGEGHTKDADMLIGRFV